MKDEAGAHRTRAAGAAAGLAAGAFAATVYCLHCPEVSAIFVLTWYSLGILLLEQLAAAKKTLDPLVRELAARELTTDASVAKVSIVGAGLHNAPGYAARMFGTLADAGVNIEMISTSEVRITCMIAEADLETALRALHDAFELERPEAVDAGNAAAG